MLNEKKTLEQAIRVGQSGPHHDRKRVDSGYNDSRSTATDEVKTQ
jgi:hypothetical protein